MLIFLVAGDGRRKSLKFCGDFRQILRGALALFELSVDLAETAEQLRVLALERRRQSRELGCAIGEVSKIAPLLFAVKMSRELTDELVHKPPGFVHVVLIEQQATDVL